MPALHQFPELCGCVYITAHTDDLLTHAKSELDQLAAFGWKISKDQTADCDIQILDSDKIENMQPDVATVILCKAPHDAAIEPDGFAIL